MVTREHVLREREFERLLLGAGRLSGTDRIEPRAAVLIMGRLGLRGTAASYHAGNGLEMQSLKGMFGWRDNKTPNKYLSIDGEMVRRGLQEVY